MRALKHWLAELPTTALVIATGCVLAVLTALFYFAATLFNRAIPEGSWALWLAFLAAMLGVGYAQFAKKRATYLPSRAIPSASPDYHVHDDHLHEEGL